jgi:crotonobetainyl-CoA:carnitine CoA-transferase CaiB-like acyl-CoA transferase
MTPLDGVRVLDLTRNIPGPSATQLLGDLGADVLKVEEPPVGDPTRVVPPAAEEESVTHRALNRHKRSLVVDLRTEAGAGVVGRLAAKADVLVEGFRPGVLSRRGLGPEALLARNPRLVYCSLTGYGREGHLAARAGHDVNFLARSGFLWGTREGRGGRSCPWPRWPT